MLRTAEVIACERPPSSIDHPAARRVKREDAVGELPGRAVPTERQHREFDAGPTLERKPQFKRHEGIKTRFDERPIRIDGCDWQS